MVSTTEKNRLLHQQPFNLLRENQEDNGCLVSVGMEHYSTFENEQCDWLHIEERQYFESLSSNKRQASYLLGRIAAKNALLSIAPGGLSPEINIRMGAFKEPIPFYLSDQPMQVSITHSSSMAAAVAFPPTHPMAIDLEDLDPKRAETIKKKCQAQEWEGISNDNLDPTVLFTILWTAKEALSKVLKIGLTSPMNLLEIKKIAASSTNEWAGFFLNYSQYQFNTWLVGNRVVSIVFPKQSRLVFEKKAPTFFS